MKKKLLATLGTVALGVGVSLAAASPASAAATFTCELYDQPQYQLQVCAVHNSNYVQAYESIAAKPGWVIGNTVMGVKYFNNTATIYDSTMHLYDNFGPTKQVAHGSYFQVSFEYAGITFRSPTTRVD